MRKWLALILVFALCACAPAWAEGVTDALGLTGSGESAVRGDLSARTLALVGMTMTARQPSLWAA